MQRNAELARIQAEEAARKLAAAKWKPESTSVETQTDSLPVVISGPTKESLDRELMLEEEKIALQAEMQAREEQLSLIHI